MVVAALCATANAENLHPLCAEAIAERMAQRSPKMKLSAAEGARAERATRAQLARSATLRSLAPVMPHTAVELARAIDERQLPEADADAIADYLVQLVAALRPKNLDRLDRNHSHVAGRYWRQIDYSNEPMTWQGQKRYWSPRGVADFRTVTSVDAYFRGAAKLRYFARIYRPRGSMNRFRYRATPLRSNRQRR